MPRTHRCGIPALVVRFVDHEGAALFSGTAEEVSAWLDAQGAQLVTGTHQETVEYLQRLRDEGKPGFPFWLVSIWFVPVLTGSPPSDASSNGWPEAARPTGCTTGGAGCRPGRRRTRRRWRPAGERPESARSGNGHGA